MATNPITQLISITGSVGAGVEVVLRLVLGMLMKIIPVPAVHKKCPIPQCMKNAAPNLTKCSLELGGKAPGIVCMQGT